MTDASGTSTTEAPEVSGVSGEPSDGGRIPDREADCTACSEKEAPRSRRID